MSAIATRPAPADAPFAPVGSRHVDLADPPAASRRAALPAPDALPHPRRTSAVRQEVVVVTADADDVVARVLTVLARRGCSPCSITYARGDRHRHGRLHLVLECRGGRPHKLADWLANLVDVLDVQVG